MTWGTWDGVSFATEVDVIVVPINLDRSRIQIAVGPPGNEQIVAEVLAGVAISSYRAHVAAAWFINFPGGVGVQIQLSRHTSRFAVREWSDGKAAMEAGR